MLITEIVPNKINPRKIDKEALEKLKKSIQDFPEMLALRPLVINEKNEILGGNMRYRAAKELGIKDLPVVVAKGLTKEQEKEFVIKDNLAMGDWNWALLSENWDIDLLNDWGLEMPDSLFTELDDVKEDDFDVEPPAEPKSKLGELYKLGEHRLLCGDATNLEDVEKLMANEVADLCVTDPPYNVSYKGKTKDSLTIKNDAMDNDSFYSFLLDAHTNMYAVMKQGAGLYVFHADSEGMNFRKAFKESGFALKQCCIWVKQTLVMGRQDFHWKHEPVLYGWKEGATHNWYSDRKQTTVLDLFGGSGSTLIACEQTGRKCRMMELDPRYVDVIIARWETLTGQKAEKIA